MENVNIIRLNVKFLLSEHYLFQFFSLKSI